MAADQTLHVVVRKSKKDGLNALFNTIPSLRKIQRQETVDNFTAEIKNPGGQVVAYALSGSFPRVAQAEIITALESITGGGGIWAWLADASTGEETWELGVGHGRRPRMGFTDAMDEVRKTNPGWQSKKKKKAVPKK